PRRFSMGKRSLFLALIPALMLVSNTPAQNSMIRGKVRATNGVTVNNAIVELRMAGSGMIGQTVTRNDGDFAFTGLVSGENEVAVIWDGYEAAVERVGFHQSPRDNFQEVITLEVMVKPKADQLLAAPGTTFVQDIPKAARVVYEKGIAKLEEGKSADGIELLHEAIGLFDNYFNAYYALARELYRTSKYAQALEPLAHARHINDREDALS